MPALPSTGTGLSSGQTASNNDDEFHRRSIVGLWHAVYTSGGAIAFESFETWHSDGTEFEAADLQLGLMCQGTWVKSAPGTVRLFRVGWNFDPTGADGKTYSGTFAIQNFDLSGNHLQGQDESGTVHATRFTVP